MLVALCASVARANIIADADSAYMADDFLTAASLYDAAIDSLGTTAERYYKIGNGYYRAGLPVMAIVS